MLEKVRKDGSVMMKHVEQQRKVNVCVCVERGVGWSCGLGMHTVG